MKSTLTLRFNLCLSASELADDQESYVSEISEYHFNGYNVLFYLVSMFLSFEITNKNSQIWDPLHPISAFN